jgi:FkbM family methyltransferase
MSIRTTSRDLLAAFPRADALFRRLVWSRVHYPEVEMRFLQSLAAGSIDIAIDVGAAHGSYAWILNRKARQVVSFEPGEAHARYMAQAVAGTRIELVQAAVGNQCGTVRMYTPGEDATALHSATLAAHNPVVASLGTTVREVQQVTLDSFFIGTRDTGRSIDVLKVDVEGYELQVFEGAIQLLTCHHPLIFCEIEARHNEAYGKLFSLLQQLGYQCYIHRSGGFEKFDGAQIEVLQRQEDLAVRLSRNYDPMNNRYINNFVFQHRESRIKVQP